MSARRTLLLTAATVAGAAAVGLMLTPRARRAESAWLRSTLDHAQAALEDAEAQIQAAGADFQERLRGTGVEPDWQMDARDVSHDLPRMPRA